ncbi:DUF1127 domain-containing protein [Palleronia abyssalis]|uniref:YjiS-like domain-containing protein n=1 Tax=Palleronia abyssalis TaxID=1501240 RepID=A0A2R8BSZ9_9RHOB|nr:DUF1127 domain-containing protein [Palleronia abyssalis]SPJ23292.1 hypothetical protein PAA8504_01102 [Palleronia abyssalis]
MATLSNIRFDTGFLGRLRAELATRRAQRQEYNRVHAELDGLSNRDLLDIGISRGQIDDIARQAAGY